MAVETDWNSRRQIRRRTVKNIRFGRFRYVVLLSIRRSAVRNAKRLSFDVYSFFPGATRLGFLHVRFSGATFSEDYVVKTSNTIRYSDCSFLHVTGELGSDG